MTRLAIVIPSLRGGGAERSMITLANECVKYEIAVDLVVMNAAGVYANDISDGVRLIDLRARRASTSLLGLIRYLRTERPVAMLSAMRHVNIVAAAARKLARSPCRLVASERNSISKKSLRRHSIRSRLVLRLLSKTYRSVDAITAVSEGVADDIRDLTGIPREQIVVVGNPVTGPELLKKSQERIDHAWLCDIRQTVILGAGRLVPQKRFDVLVKAFAAVRRHRDIKLVIMGEGPGRGELERLILEFGVEDSVHLPGFVDNPFPYMRASSLFVLSSEWEGLPGVLIQAMACGTKVVSTDCHSGPAEILEGGKWGRLVEVADVSGLAQAIEWSLDDSATPDVARRANDFSVDRAVSSYLGVLFPNFEYGKQIREMRG